MKFEIEQDDSYTVLSLKTERMDSKVAPDLKSQVILLANSSEHGDLVLDLSTVTFADSSGLSALLMAQRLYRDSDRNLVLCGLTDKVNKLIEISQLQSVFNIATNRESAVELLAELGQA